MLQFNLDFERSNTQPIVFVGCLILTITLVVKPEFLQISMLLS
jgi:hypothetical protein